MLNMIFRKQKVHLRNKMVDKKKYEPKWRQKKKKIRQRNNEVSNLHVYSNCFHDFSIIIKDV